MNIIFTQNGLDNGSSNQWGKLSFNSAMQCFPRSCSSSVLWLILFEEHSKLSKRSLSWIVYLFSAVNMDKASFSIIFNSPFQLMSMSLLPPKLIPAPTNRTILFFVFHILLQGFDIRLISITLKYQMFGFVNQLFHTHSKPSISVPIGIPTICTSWNTIR